MASRFVAPKRLETLEDVRKALQLVQEQFDANGISQARGQLVTKSTTLASGEFVRISPRQGQTLVAKLPKATADNTGLQIVISLERPNGTLKIAAQKPDTIAGLSTASFTVAGLILLRSNGTDQWVLFNQLPTNSPASPVVDAEYVLGSANGALPNAAVGTDSTEVDFSFTPGGVATWALNLASVGFSKLANLTGLSVLGRAANSTGVMAAITATSARQVLRVNDAGNALEWGYPVEIENGIGLDQGDAFTIRGVDGTFTTASVLAGSGIGQFSWSVNLPALLAAIDSTSIVVNGSTLERSALFGAIESAQNSTGTTFSFGASGAGLTGGGGTTLNVGAGAYITVNANDVAWQGFDLDLNTTGSPSTGWKGIDLIDSPTATWNVSAPGGGRVGLSINADPDSEVTIATTGNLDLTFADVPAGTKRLTLTGAAPVLRSIEGGTNTGRKLKLYYNGSGTCIVLNSSATGASGNESRIFNPDNAAVYLFPRQGAMIQANGTLGWRLYVDAMNRNHTAGDGVNPPNTFSMFDTNGDFNFANNGPGNGFIISTGLGVGGYFDVTTRFVSIVASGDDITLDTNADMNLNADMVRITSATAGANGGFLVIKESSASTPSMAAGDGMFWVQNTAPNVPMFTSDTNVDAEIITELRVASTGQAGIIEIATQAEQETGTDTTRAVTPGHQQFHDSACKAWGRITASGTLDAGYNVSSTTDGGTGIMTANFTTSFSAASTYATVVGVTAVAFTSNVASAATGSVQLRSYNTSNALAEPTLFWFASFGDQ